jgi:hypothetical protein
MAEPQGTVCCRRQQVLCPQARYPILVGALFIASMGHFGSHTMMYSGAALLGTMDLLLAGVRQFGLAVAVFAVAGVSMVTVAANTMLQIAAPEHICGRVMSMYVLVTGGMPPVGAPELCSAPTELAIAGAIGACSAAAVFRWHQLTRPAGTPAVATVAAVPGNGNGGEH